MMFELDETLASDTIEIGEFNLCKVLLMNDSQYPWLILVPKIANVKEIFELTKNDQRQLMLESNYVLEAMSKMYSADKMNVAALGNMVPQLHIHHIARYTSDIAWPGPVWGVAQAKPYSKNELESVLPKLELMVENFNH